MSTVRLHQSSADDADMVPMPRMAAAETAITLRRSGGRPVRFHGLPVASATGWMPNSHLWHEINLYRTDRQRHVAEIRVFKKSASDRDIFHVADFDTIEEAIGWLEAFDPRHDVLVDIHLDDPTHTTAMLSLQAVVLRQRMEEAQRQYRAVIGDLLFEMKAV